MMPPGPFAAIRRRIAAGSTCTPSAISSQVTSGEVSAAPKTPVSRCAKGRMALKRAWRAGAPRSMAAMAWA